MKEKRYYCDWASRVLRGKGHEHNVYKKVLLIFTIVVVGISGFICYNIIMHNHGEDLEAYDESAYKYLDEIADNVIGKDGINEAAIPEDVVEYEIIYTDGEIIFKYSLDNNKGKEFATSASMTVTLSKDFEVLSKKPNFSSKEEYIKEHKIGLYFLCLMFGILTYSVISLVIMLVMTAAEIISEKNKKRDMKNNLS